MRKLRPSRFAQSNRQTTVVRVNCGGCGRSRRVCGCKRCRFRRRRRCKSVVGRRESVCGRIFQLCDGASAVYFSAVPAAPSAIVRIDNVSQGEMRVELADGKGNRRSGLVRQGQQVSFRVSGLAELAVSCNGAGGVCHGTYRIVLEGGTDGRDSGENDGAIAGG